MWMFYSIGLPLTLGMVAATLKYFAGPDTPLYVLSTVGYTWFCSLSFIVLVPADIWTTLSDGGNGGINFFWSWSYWSTFLLTWGIVPLLQGFEDAGDFTVSDRLKTSIHVNLLFYISVGVVGMFGVAILILLNKLKWDGVMGLAIACSNTFGLVTGVFLLGFGLIEIPRSLWRNADWQQRQRILSHRIAQVAVSFGNAHQELSTAMVISQATSNQMSRRDPLRPFMDVIDSMLLQMAKDDSSFNPSGGQIGESDMDYDADEKSMATLRWRLREAWNSYCRFKSEYTAYVWEALELEDTVKNFSNGRIQNWKYNSSLHSPRLGTLASTLDTAEWIWRCILRKHLQRMLAATMGCMSAALLFAEATLLPNGLDLSLFSLFIKAVGQQEMLVQIVAFIPLMYMCACTYFSLFKLGSFAFYSLTPKYTSSVSLLMICSMVARYAPPVCYNFLNLIRLGDSDKHTTFEKRMGKIDEAVPFFGNRFNKIYPLFMVLFTILIACNFFDRLADFFGNWRRFRFENESKVADGFDPLGVKILQKERNWLEEGHSIGGNIVSLAQNGNNLSGDVEAEAMLKKSPQGVVVHPPNSNSQGQSKHVPLFEPGKPNGKQPSKSADVIATYPLREQQKSSSSLSLANNSFESSSVTLSNNNPKSKWESMKSSFQGFKNNLAMKRFSPINQEEPKPNTKVAPPPSMDSLESIFESLKRKKGDYDNDEDDAMDLGLLHSSSSSSSK